MTLQEYEEIKNSLLKKRKKGNSCPNFIATNQNKTLYIVLDVCYYITIELSRDG